MSAINLWLSRDRALLGTDTICQDMNSSRKFGASKMTVLAHAGVVLAGRGTTLGLYTVTSGLAQLPEAQDVDSICAYMPQMLPRWFEIMGKMAGDKVPDASVLQQQQLIVAGWSSAERRVRAVMFQQAAAGEGFQQAEIEEPGYICPWEDGMDVPEPPETVALQRELLEYQVRYCGSKYPGRPLGGRLLLAELTQGGVSVSSHWIRAAE